MSEHAEEKGLGYCNRHRWLHAKDCGPSLPPVFEACGRLLKMPFDIHCPKCGEFQHEKGVAWGRKVSGCPRCGNKQAISLWHRQDIDDRFKDEQIRGKGRNQKEEDDE